MAVRACSVLNCKSTSKKTRCITFPTDVFRFQQWAEFTGNPKIIHGMVQRPSICVRHFERKYFMSGNRRQRLLRSSGAVPTLHGPGMKSDDRYSDKVSESEPDLPIIFKSVYEAKEKQKDPLPQLNAIEESADEQENIEVQDEDYDSSQSITEHLAAVAAQNATIEMESDGHSQIFNMSPVEVEQLEKTTEEDDGEVEPLYLSSYLGGNISEGRRLSRVVPLAGNVKSHSGYFTVNREFDSHMFFWFFPHTSCSPLVIWINGPCEPGTNGVFRQSGPYNYNGEDITIRPFSWIKLYSMLYIDAPVGSGYSFTNGQAGRPTDCDSVGADLYSTVAQFFEMFFEYKESQIYIVGMGMGAKLALALGRRFVSYGDTRFRGIALGNPLLDVDIQTDHKPYLSALGILDSASAMHCDVKQAELKYALKENDGIKFFQIFSEFYLGPDSVLNDITGLDSTFSFVREMIDEDRHWLDLVNSAEMKYALHVGSEALWDNGERALSMMPKLLMDSSLPVLGILLEHVKVILINGQEDLRFPYPMMMNCARSIEWSFKENFTMSKRYRMQRVAAGQVEGFSTKCETLTAVMIRKASHLVFSDRPDFTLQVFANFVKDKPSILALKYSNHQLDVL